MAQEMRSYRYAMAFLAFVAIGLVTLAPSHSQAQSTERLDVATASAKQLGIRYGQAAGIELVCYGLKITPDVEKLKSRFAGSERKIFDAEASKVLTAWTRVLRCEQSTGPNECKLSHVWSCQQGYKELGPEGTIIPGLVRRK